MTAFKTAKKEAVIRDEQKSLFLLADTVSQNGLLLGYKNLLESH